jgi:hypothetical protein
MRWSHCISQGMSPDCIHTIQSSSRYLRPNLCSISKHTRSRRRSINASSSDRITLRHLESPTPPSRRCLSRRISIQTPATILLGYMMLGNWSEIGSVMRVGQKAQRSSTSPSFCSVSKHPFRFHQPYTSYMRLLFRASIVLPDPCPSSFPYSIFTPFARDAHTVEHSPNAGTLAPFSPQTEASSSRAAKTPNKR